MMQESVKQTNLKFVNKSPNADPDFGREGNSGFDLRAWIQADEGGNYNYESGQYTIELKPFERRLIHTGLYFTVPFGTEIQVRPRSGFALKKGVTVLNTPGTIDENYTGEICVIAANISNEPVIITSGERIAQAVLVNVLNSHFTVLEKVDEIEDNKERGKNGFGSSGMN